MFASENKNTPLHALICGGNWNNGAHDGSRAANCNNYPWNVNANNGVRCVCDYFFMIIMFKDMVTGDDFNMVVRRLSCPGNGRSYKNQVA